MNKEVFISYSWKEPSTKIADQIEAAFQTKEITFVRDKNDLGYKGKIKEFMERIGQGKCVIVVISDPYLKSKNCMFELLQIAKNNQFSDRIFPIVLPETKIYDSLDRLDYIKYWEDKINKLETAMNGVSNANLHGIR